MGLLSVPADESFWAPEPMLYHARALGFEFFGADHLVCLAVSAVLVATVLAVYLQLPAQPGSTMGGTRLKMLRIVTSIPVALVLAKSITYLVLGLFEPLFWPLHVCNLCELVAWGYALAPSTRVGGRCADLLFCWGLTGCPSALVFPGWAWYCPALCFASLCGFVEHALVFACALCAVVGGEYVPQPRRVWFALLVSVVCGVFFRLVNPLLGTNFFFVTNPIGAGGPFPWLVATFGDPGFLVAYLCLAAGAWCAIYGICCLVKHLRCNVKHS